MLALMALMMATLLRHRRRIAPLTVETPPQIPGETEKALEAANDAGRQLEAKLNEQAALKHKLELEALNALKLPQVTTKKSEILTRHIGEAAKKDPTLMVHVLRSWLEEDR